MPRFQHLDDASQADHRPEKTKFTTAAHHAGLKPALAHTRTQSRDRPLPEERTFSSNSASYSPRSALGSRTYESFWREHSMNAPSKPLQIPPMKSSPGPSLAPPADILPRSRPEAGTPDTPHFFAARSPRLDSPISNRDGSPATPGKQRSSIRTASQNAAMEKDAVETLLFMSSPGNSGHHPPGRRSDNPTTTLQQQRNFPRPAKQVGFADENGGGGGGGSSSRYGINANPDQSPVTPLQPYLCERGLLKPGQRLTGADVDRYLDQMADDSSSSSSDDHDDFSYTTRPHSRQQQQQQQQQHQQSPYFDR